MACLQSLFLSNPRDDLAAIRSVKGNRVDGTCDWILAQDSYTSWLIEDSPQLLWLSGGPGIGKTMISSFMVEELTRLAERSSQITLAYYFCDDKDEKRKSATAILRGLLLQLLRQRPMLFKHIQPEFAVSRDNLFTNFHGLWRIFDGILKDPEAGEVFCLIDALDECEKESRQSFLTNLTELFTPLQTKKKIFKFIITSRPENDIEESLTTASPSIRNIRVDTGKVNDDLSKFINIRVDELSRKKGYQPNQKDIIKRTLTDKAGGSFLYVSIVLHELQKAKIFSQVIQNLQKLPSDLNDVYDRILGQIDAEHQETAKSVLCWVAVARRPLTVEELAMARALGAEECEENIMPPEDLLDELKDGFKCCEPLVYIDTNNNTVNLVNQSAKDYLLSTYLQGNRNLSQYHITEDSTNLHIFQTCWEVLSLEKQRRKQSHDYDGFSAYAAREWEEHAVAAGRALITGYEFRKDNLDRLPTLRDTWLRRAAAEGQELVVQRLLENGAELESKDRTGSTPLLLAAREGQEAVVKLLLENGAEPGSKDRSGQTPLSYAAEGGYVSVVKLLLSRNDVAPDFQDNRYGQTPLSWAAENGHEAVVKLLLSRDNVVADSRDKDGRTPLSWAAENGHEAVVKLLLSRDDVVADSPDNSYGQTPLSHAAENGHEVVVKLLLSRDDVVADSPDNSYGQTPLSHAAEKGHEVVVKLLLSRDDVVADSQNKYCRTPLSWAARNGHEVVVKLLLSRDDVAADSQDKDGQTPLSWAARRGYEVVVKLLLSRDDVAADSQDEYGRTPLSWAAENGHEAVVKLLLSRDDVAADSQDEHGRTPLSWAAEKGHEEVVKLLLSRDVEADSQDKDGRTPLSLADENGHEAVVELLKQKMRDASNTTGSSTADNLE